jgi:EAL domain-containing protein (putative c-di-GMP-specific phosphodiesterase class I)
VQSSFVDHVARILEETGLEAGALELEITESLLMQHTEGVIDTLAGLKTLGVGLAIDDFGMGYSSFSHLRALPIDRVKISSDFVCRMHSCVKEAAIVRAIIAVALILDLGVVAEGVERVDHFRFLKTHGCTEAQGFYFGRPLPDADVVHLLKQAPVHEEHNTLKISTIGRGTHPPRSA